MDEIATRVDKIQLEYKEIQDRMLEAMKILTDHSVSELAFDRTIECVVVGTEKKDEGIYTVEYESARFEAYAKKTDSYSLRMILIIKKLFWAVEKMKMLKVKPIIFNFHLIVLFH